VERNKRKIIWLTGVATFFFGFGAAAVLNLYLYAVRSPLVLNFRSSLNFISSIFGDGLILPVVNMLVVSHILNCTKYVNKLRFTIGTIIGLLITIYFHVIQAVKGLVNWSMPTPWRWNLLGLWHFFYMLSVTSLLSFYFIVSVSEIIQTKKLPKNFIFVILGIMLFLTLLKLDYANVRL
jgi:hypothetical protein